MSVSIATEAAETADPAREHRRAPWPALGLAVIVSGGVVLVLRLGSASTLPAVATFCAVFASVALEALPFVLLGAIVSAGLAAFVPDRAFARVARLPVALQVPAAVTCGMAFPVCECGSVPVARRLLLRGLHPSAAVAFMLAAPVVNPVVLASTAVAFSGRHALALVTGRALLGVIVAVVVGLVVGRRADLVRVRAGAQDDHGHAHASRLRMFADHVGADFSLMGRFVAGGAALAALMQTVVPQRMITGLAGELVVSILVLMALAFLLSLCSEADAFVGASLIGFGLPAQLAFLAFGPVLDLKLASLYAGTFGPRFVARVAAVAVPTVVAGGLVFAAVVGR